MSKAKDSEKAGDKEPSYRDAMAELDGILAALDDRTGLDIDELASRVERASTLLRILNERLKGAEARVGRVTAELARATDAVVTGGEDAGDDE